MKKPSVIAVRLRRYLGALLAVGFGATWWSFIPPARAAAPAPQMSTCLPKPISIEPAVEPIVEMAARIGKAIVPHAGVTPKPRKPHRKPKRVPVSVPPTDTPPTPGVGLPVATPDVTPVLSDEPIRIPTRSS
jgi:hypothetical protein